MFGKFVNIYLEYKDVFLLCFPLKFLFFVISHVEFSLGGSLILVSYSML